MRVCWYVLHIVVCHISACKLNFFKTPSLPPSDPHRPLTFLKYKHKSRFLKRNAPHVLPLLNIKCEFQFSHRSRGGGIVQTVIVIFQVIIVWQMKLQENIDEKECVCDYQSKVAQCIVEFIYLQLKSSKITVQQSITQLLMVPVLVYTIDC